MGRLRLAHLIVTRFNLGVAYAPPGLWLERAWLERRLEPFEAYSVPSVGAQTTPTTWLVVCDAASPPWLRERIAGYAGVTPVWLEQPHTVDTLRAAVAEHVEPGSTHLLTSRLDSDDALGADYAARLRSACRPGRAAHFLSFPLGWVLEQSRRRLYLAFWPSGPFLNHLEPLGPEPPLTAYRTALNFAAFAAPVRQLRAPPMWLQAVHDLNVESEVRGVRWPARTIPRRFAALPAAGALDDEQRFTELARGLPGYARELAPTLGRVLTQGRAWSATKP